MAGDVESRNVVRLACGHEALQVVGPGEVPAAVGDRFPCHECGREQPIVEFFEVEP